MYRYIALVTAVLLFFIPFLWFSAGEVDLGGDSSRLYFYDPISYLLQQSFYSIVSSGTGGEAISFYSIPYITLIFLVKFIFQFPTTVISIFHGVSLSLAFVFCYLSVVELVRSKLKEHPSLVVASATAASLLYVFSPALILGWDKVILTHSQFFLNPLMFWLLLKYFTSKRTMYMFIILLVSFLFSVNFSYVAAPPFFAFYPFAVLFILLYVIFVRKQQIPIKQLVFFGILFLLLHAFHLIPQIISILSPGSGGNAALFSEESKFSRGLSYFLGIAPEIRVSINLMSLPQMMKLGIFSGLFIILPFVIVLGFIWNKSKTYLLTGLFFIISLFFISAHITDSWFYVYKSLFAIPGFSMFRNFFGQWSYFFTFFYVLLLGQALIIVGERFGKRNYYLIPALIVLLLTVNASKFITGELLDKVHHQSKNVRMLFEMDPVYEDVLSYFRAAPIDGKILSFPLTGPGYQMIKGVNGGAYQGPSTISYLTGKNDFTGYSGLGLFGEIFVQTSRYKDYETLERILSILNIKYLFHNEDPYIYDSNFPGYPYDYVRDFMPKAQKEYKDFITNLPVQQEKKFGDFYTIYSINNDSYLPHIFPTKNIIYTNNFLLPHFILKQDSDLRTVTFDLQNYLAGEQLVFEAKNTTPIIELFDNYHLHVHAPFISRRLDDILYPLAVWREQYELNNKKKNPDEFLDYNHLFLSKRIFELDKFGDTIPVTKKTWDKPSPYKLFAQNNYNSWEASFTRYEEQMLSLIDWIPQSGKDENGQKVIKLKVSENLHQHELKVLRKIQDGVKSADDKKYLLKKTHALFNSLFNKLSLIPYDPSIITYSFSMSNSFTGSYELFIRNVDDKLGNVQKMNIETDGKHSAVHKINEEGNMVQFDDIILSQGENFFKLHYQPENLVATTQWENSGTSEKIEDITSIHLGNISSNNAGMVREIKDWRANRQYVMTFEYNTFGKDVIFKFFDKSPKKDTRGYTNNTFFEKNLNATNWKTHQSILTSHPESVAGFLQIVSNSDEEISNIAIRNISVYEVPNPSLILRKKIQVQNEKDIPTLTFQKINPTKYIVHVKNAKDYYTLVFSEQFNKAWKLYKSDENYLQDQDITASYFDNAVGEVAHTNSFWDNTIFTTFSKKPIADDTHYAANGYANAWIIDSKDVGSSLSYDLIIEYAPQRNFYILFVISTVTFITLLLYFIMKIIRR